MLIRPFSFESLKGILGKPKNDHPRFHGHCKTENRPIMYEVPLLNGQIVRFPSNYYCLKHKVYCGPSFWEWGWYEGTDSRKMLAKRGPKPKEIKRFELVKTFA